MTESLKPSPELCDSNHKEPVSIRMEAGWTENEF